MSMEKMNIKKGDRVRVIAGKDKGAEGIVTTAKPRERRVVVENVNLIKKAMRPSQANPEGGISTLEAPLNVSNVQLICPSCKEPTRVSVKHEEGKKVRVCKKCGADID